jgi:hypothetical protein
VFATSLLLNRNSTDFFRNFLIMLMEPASWFFFWDGLEMILFKSNEINHDLNFYRKMSGCRISFRTLPR